MIESPLQILRERVAGNINNIFDNLRSPLNWLKYLFNILKKGR